MPVVVTGAAEVESWLREAPGRLTEGSWTATNEAVRVIRTAVRAGTPVGTASLHSHEPPGTLRESVTSQVTRLSTGARGVVSSSLRYTPYVERGTARHGAARHMFQAGNERTRGQVVELYEAMATKVARSAG